MKPFNVTLVTLFPDMFPGPLGMSILGRATEAGAWTLDVVDIRDFASDKHKSVDGTPYGGGAGMVMRADIVAQALRHAKTLNPDAKVVFMAPAGKKFTQEKSREFADETGLIILCGHYEGVDQRVIDTLVDEEISIGDYVLSGGEMAAYVVVDAVLRHKKGVLGAAQSLHEESFDLVDDAGNTLVEYPHYTRPDVWEGQEVPEVLKSGHHKNIETWRREAAKSRTLKNRPDLIKK